VLSPARTSPITALHRGHSNRQARPPLGRPHRCVLCLWPGCLVGALGQPARRLWTRNESAAKAGARRDAVFGCAPHLWSAISLHKRVVISDIQSISCRLVCRRNTYRDHNPCACLLACKATDGTRARGGGYAERGVGPRPPASAETHSF